MDRLTAIWIILCGCIILFLIGYILSADAQQNQYIYDWKLNLDAKLEKIIK